ncbi:hypothetical protein EVAR_97736_1 [Eumeta japonica]|uniref:Uncharacterized protein n=1 Tax=Eumeta variegata TaxID=151549 RepID=A0A4C1XA40_EUMVA|nr:hypothetical protein EVAR_97736_1 [Eumeta japonica]
MIVNLSQPALNERGGQRVKPFKPTQKNCGRHPVPLAVIRQFNDPRYDRDACAAAAAAVRERKRSRSRFELSTDSTDFLATRAHTATVLPGRPAANPLQFIKVGPAELGRSAREQLRRAELAQRAGRAQLNQHEDWQSTEQPLGKDRQNSFPKTGFRL